MQIEELKKIVQNLIGTFKEAGNISLELRKKGLKKELKEDNTPVTNGDIAVNNILLKKISDLTPHIPIVSEETSKNKDNKDLKDFWLIDPIDGTSSYINNKDEFTINAALIINKKPVAGIINAPEKGRLFYSYGHTNSFELINNKEIKLFDIKKKRKEIIAVTYSDTPKPEILQFHKKFNVSKFQKMKSSLKFCVVAASEFDLYIADARACEWDIAAGHAILEHSGGSLNDFNGNEIIYGKPNFKNPALIMKNKNLV